MLFVSALLTGEVRQPPHKFHVLTAGLIQPVLELHGAGGCQGVLLLEGGDGDRLHGLVHLHQQFPDLQHKIIFHIYVNNYILHT
jgi:hypothetical protein